ncbi:MAG: hypothetical protein HXY45_01540, partial [Syntrophaceae bacterium]|nr:hypothetical protein [Syntrophaceae bacterium]
MKFLISLVLALSIAVPAFAGEDPYIAVVGNDYLAKKWYVSPKYDQFMFNQAAWGVPVCDGSFPAAYSGAGQEKFDAGCEQFRSMNAQNAPEVCYYSTDGGPSPTLVNFNAKVAAGNWGWYEWYVRLPKKPSGQINLVLQCGVLKPNSFAFWEYESIELCAAETGERVGRGTCVREEVNPGWNPLVIGALPKIKAIA